MNRLSQLLILRNHLESAEEDLIAARARLEEADDILDDVEELEETVRRAEVNLEEARDSFGEKEQEELLVLSNRQNFFK